MVYGITGRKDWNKVKWNYLCTVSWKFGHCYFLSDFFDVLSSNYYYFGFFFFPIKKKQGVNNCFKPLISSAFTTVASRLKLEQKEKGK